MNWMKRPKEKEEEKEEEKDEEEEESYNGERVDWPAVLPVDLGALVLQQLQEPEHLLQASHVCRSLRRTADSRGLWRRLAQGTSLVQRALSALAHPSPPP